MTRTVLGIDVGGTKLLGGVVRLTPTGPEVLGSRELPAPRTESGVDPGLRALAELATDLAGLAREHGQEPAAVGIGVPEYVVDDEVLHAEVLVGDRQPRDLLAALLPGVPVRVEADVRCAALAEAQARGVGPGTSVLYLSWGTGLSSTLLVDGVPLAGRRGEALALGEWPVAAQVDRSWAGNLEQYAAGRSLGLRHEAASGVVGDARAVVGLAERGDPVALRVVESASLAVAHALAQVVLLLDPDLVVLGGGLGSSGTMPPRRVAELLPTLLRRPGPPPVEAATTGPLAGMLGAALLAAGQGVQPGATGRPDPIR